MEPCLFVIYPECRLKPYGTVSWPQPLLGSVSPCILATPWLDQVLFFRGIRFVSREVTLQDPGLNLLLQIL